MGDVVQQMVFDEVTTRQKQSLEKVSNLIKSLKIQSINAVRVDPRGFVAVIDGLEKIDKKLLTEGSLCIYSGELIDSCVLRKFSEWKGYEKSIHVYVRLGRGNTWLYANYPTFIGEAISNYEKAFPDEDEDYVPKDDSYYDNLNRQSVIVAKAKGFNLLKNYSQRKEFAKEVLAHTDENVDEYEYGNIAATSITFYDYGILPIEATRLKESGKTEAEIAKILGHTKAKIEKSLMIDVSENTRYYIEEYEKNFDKN